MGDAVFSLFNSRDMSAANGDAYLHAVRGREYCADVPGGSEVWRYSLHDAADQPIDDFHVRCGTQWTGVFECAAGRHVEVLPWAAANAIVVAAANAVYIVDPRTPEQFSGFAAPVEVTGITFDESSSHMFVADSTRIYAFSSDRRFRWISEPLDGYDARFCGCGRFVLAIELRQSEPGPEGEEAAPSVIRLRIEDGTILRSRFRLVHRYWMKNTAA
jgi:hypothetical protein